MNTSACPQTCENKDHYRDCELTIEGCGCTNGTILSSDVSELELEIVS